MASRAGSGRRLLRPSGSTVMTGSLADHDALCAAFARQLLAEAEFDARPTVTNAKAADLTYAAMVSAAVRCDPHSLRSPSISQWVERRCCAYRDQCASGFRQSEQSQGSAG